MVTTADGRTVKPHQTNKQISALVIRIFEFSQLRNDTLYRTGEHVVCWHMPEQCTALYWTGGRLTFLLFRRTSGRSPRPPLRWSRVIIVVLVARATGVASARVVSVSTKQEESWVWGCDAVRQQQQPPAEMRSLLAADSARLFEQRVHQRSANPQRMTVDENCYLRR